MYVWLHAFIDCTRAGVCICDGGVCICDGGVCTQLQ